MICASLNKSLADDPHELHGFAHVRRKFPKSWCVVWWTVDNKMHATRREESLGRLLRGKPSSQSVKRVMKAISTNLGRRGLTLLPCCFSVRSTSFVPLNADLFFSCAFLFYVLLGRRCAAGASLSCHHTIMPLRHDATRLSVPSPPADSSWQQQ